MLEKEFTIKDVIAIIVSPFAFAGAALLAILSLFEFFRRGFVSLFIDMRIVFVVSLILWATSAWCVDKRKRSWITLITTGLLLAALLTILWKMTAPFGRLGLIAFACGLATSVAIFIASLKLTPKP